MDNLHLPVFIHPTEFFFTISDRGTHKQILTIYNPYDFAIRYKIRSTSPKKYSVSDPEDVIECRGIADIAIRHLAATAENLNVRDKFRIQLFEHNVLATVDTSQSRQIAMKEFSAKVIDTQQGKTNRPIDGLSESGLPFNDSLLQPVSQEPSVQFDSLSSSRIPSRLHNDTSPPTPSSLPVGTTQFSPRNNLGSTSALHNLNTAVPQRLRVGSNGNVADNKNPSPWCIALTCVCLVALLLPTAINDEYLSRHCSSSQGNSNLQSIYTSQSSSLSLHYLVPSFLHITVNQKLIAAFTLGLLTMAMLQNA